MNDNLFHEDLKKHIIGYLKENKEGALGTCLNNIFRSSLVRYFLGEDLDVYVVSTGGEKFKALEEKLKLLEEAKQHCSDWATENFKIIKIEPNEIVYLNSLVDGDRTKQILKI